MRTLRVAAGILAALVGLVALAVSAVVSFWIVGPDDVLSVTPRQVSSKGLALTSPPDLVDYYGSRAVVTVEPTTTEKDVFIGVGHDIDVRSYLGKMAQTRFTEVSYPSTVTTEEVRGTTSRVLPPGELDWWTAQVAGSGTQTLEWELADGPYDLVIMAADGTPGVDVTATFGLEFKGAFASSLAVGGAGVVLLAGAGLLFRSLRRDSALDTDVLWEDRELWESNGFWGSPARPGPTVEQSRTPSNTRGVPAHASATSAPPEVPADLGGQGAYAGQQGTHSAPQVRHPHQQGAHPSQHGAHPSQHGAHPSQHGTQAGWQGGDRVQQGDQPTWGGGPEQHTGRPGVWPGQAGGHSGPARPGVPTGPSAAASANAGEWSPPGSPASHGQPQPLSDAPAAGPPSPTPASPSGPRGTWPPTNRDALEPPGGPAGPPASTAHGFPPGPPPRTSASMPPGGPTGFSEASTRLPWQPPSGSSDDHTNDGANGHGAVDGVDWGPPASQSAHRGAGAPRQPAPGDLPGQGASEANGWWSGAPSDHASRARAAADPWMRGAASAPSPEPDLSDFPTFEPDLSDFPSFPTVDTARHDGAPPADRAYDDRTALDALLQGDADRTEGR
jgi:hypothetical protein